MPRKAPVRSRNRAKRIVSFNAIRHGLRARNAVLPCEDFGDYLALQHEIHAQYQPEPGLETELAKRICLLLWRLRRFPLIENGIVAQSEPRVHLSYTEQVDENRRRIVQAEAGDREIKR